MPSKHRHFPLQYFCPQVHVHSGEGHRVLTPWQPGWPKGIFFPSLRRSGQVDPCFSSSLCSRSRGHQVCSGGSIRLAPGAPDLAPGPCPAVPVTMGEYFPVLGLRFPTCTLSSLAKSMILNFGHTLKSARDLLKIPGPRRHQRSIK